jgi:hypothetical protein
MFFWIIFQQCKVVLYIAESMEDEKNYLDEYSTSKNLNFKTMKNSLNYEKFNINILLSKDNNIKNWLKNSFEYII